MFAKKLPIDIKTAALYLTRLVVLGVLLLVALAGCGEEKKEGVRRGRFRQMNGSGVPRPPGTTPTPRGAPTAPGRGPFR